MHTIYCFSPLWLVSLSSVLSCRNNCFSWHDDPSDLAHRGGEFPSWRAPAACEESKICKFGALKACYKGAKGFVCNQQNWETNRAVCQLYERVQILWSPRWAHAMSKIFNPHAVEGRQMFLSPRNDFVAIDIVQPLWLECSSPWQWSSHDQQKLVSCKKRCKKI